MKHRLFRSGGGGVVRFVVGRVDDDVIRQGLKQEAEKHGDILFIDSAEGYYGIANKTMAIFKALPWPRRGGRHDFASFCPGWRGSPGASHH